LKWCILSVVTSPIEGLVVDTGLFLLRKKNLVSLCVVGGFSAASNVVVLQSFLILGFPLWVYMAMYLVSFLSGFFLGGFVCFSTLEGLRGFLWR
jgi:hypothetical protein